ncbi:MAG: hypothetical protein ABJA98_00755 [Acidobacteriota bacterium]
MTAFFPRTTIVVLCAFALATSVAVSAGQTGKSGDLLTNKQVKELIASSTAAADHVKLQKHFLAVAAEYEAKAVEHTAEAEAYKKRGASYWDSKAPTGPGTATHCERFAQLEREAAKEARDLASAHGHMAAAK